MKGRTAFYFSEALRSLSTNKATSFAAVIAMFVALVVVGLTATAISAVRDTGSQVQKDASIVKVFLTATAAVDEERVNALRTMLEQNPDVESVDFVDKDEALVRARELFKDDPEIIENLPTNPFPASLEATLKDPTRMQAVSKSVEGQPGVDSVGTGDEKAEKLIDNVQIGMYIFLVIGVGILLAATVLVANTIRLSIYSRRREIEVMKLVGASNNFVRMPFMLEGLLCGVIAAIASIVAVYGAIQLMRNVLDEMFSTGATIQSSSIPLGMIIGGMLVLGVVLGMFGSASSMRKYLRV